jgi:retron-type reverse transcriptase
VVDRLVQQAMLQVLEPILDWAGGWATSAC